MQRWPPARAGPSLGLGQTPAAAARTQGHLPDELGFVGLKPGGVPSSTLRNNLVTCSLVRKCGPACTCGYWLARPVAIAGPRCSPFLSATAHVPVPATVSIPWVPWRGPSGCSSISQGPQRRRQAPPTTLLPPRGKPCARACCAPVRKISGCGNGPPRLFQRRNRRGIGPSAAVFAANARRRQARVPAACVAERLALRRAHGRPARLRYLPHDV